MVTKYKLIAPYPNHQIGDVAIHEVAPQGKGQNTFIWENTKQSLPIQFYPSFANDWWQKVEDEKILNDYQKQVTLPLFEYGTTFVSLDKFNYPQIYWTEVLKVIAQDLNKTDKKNWFVFKTNNNEFVPTLYIYNGFVAGLICFNNQQDCQKAIDLLGSNVKYLFND